MVDGGINELKIDGLMVELGNGLAKKLKLGLIDILGVGVRLALNDTDGVRL